MRSGEMFNVCAHVLGKRGNARRTNGEKGRQTKGNRGGCPGHRGGKMGTESRGARGAGRGAGKRVRADLTQRRKGAKMQSLKPLRHRGTEHFNPHLRGQRRLLQCGGCRSSTGERSPSGGIRNKKWDDCQARERVSPAKTNRRRVPGGRSQCQKSGFGSATRLRAGGRLASASAAGCSRAKAGRMGRLA